ncbi:hypothetical protein [Flexivirga meconopsidis]|uniref:hypothetical protein n=1 Tax=Flexivirga meconopsidis TaxID=2977121 RepID=UPI00223EA121|nr:hypothetical protein [Flexivirga meconopsidis]
MTPFTRRIAVTVAITASLALAGCNGDTATNDGGTVTKTVTAGAAPESAATDSSESPIVEGAEDGVVGASSDSASGTVDAGSSGTVAFGATYTSPTGRTISIGKGAPYTPGESAYVGDNVPAGAKYRKFEVTLVNKSAAPFDTNDLYFTATAGDREVGMVTDVEAGIDTPTSTMLPGRTLRFFLAYPVVVGQPLTIAVNTVDGPVATWDGVTS